MRRRRRLVLLVISVVLVARPALAQDEWIDRARVSLNFGAQIDTERLSESIELTKYVEPAPLTADASKAALPFLDAGIAVRVVRNFGVGFAFSYLTNKSDAAATARIPHPFFFARPREVSGTASGVRHKESAAHVNLVYMIPSPKIDLMLFGGGSFFSVRQSFVSDVIFAEEYPYDVATFVSATLKEESESKAGYNVGADVTWKFNDRVGVGGLIRFARARVPFSVDGHDLGKVDVGGLHASGGLRVVF